MKSLNQYIILILFTIATFLLSCEKFDLVRVMDTQTGEIQINETNVVAKGMILDISSKKIINHGHCWSISSEPTIENNLTELGEINEPGEFSSILFNIIADTTHYIRSYIFDGEKYIYGDIFTFNVSAENLNFSTSNFEIIENSLNINISSSVEGLGSLNFSDHGHCWSTIENPTIDNENSSYGPLISDNTFTSKIANLNLGRYYLRAFLRSNDNVIYSNTVIFESTMSVETENIGINGSTSASVYGKVLSLSAVPIKEHGHCWSEETSFPSVNNYKSTLGTTNQLLTYSSHLTDLKPETTYYTRAYVTDGSNVYYGEVRTFKTNPAK